MRNTTKTIINAVADNQTIDINLTAREFSILFSLLSIATDRDINKALAYTVQGDNTDVLFEPILDYDQVEDTGAYEGVELYRKLKNAFSEISKSMKPKTKTIWYFICTPKVNPDGEVSVSRAFNSKEELMETFDSYYKHSHYLVEVMQKEVPV